MRRSEARELAFTVLFEMDYHRELSPQEAVEEAVEERELPRSAYFMKLVTGAADKLDAIDEKISQNAIGWKVNRISRVSRAILRLALYEMLHEEDMPHSIAINEAVELAKKYESQEAASFINGVLGSVARGNPKPGTEKAPAEDEEGTASPTAAEAEAAAEDQQADAPAESGEDAPPSPEAAEGIEDDLTTLEATDNEEDKPAAPEASKGVEDEPTAPEAGVDVEDNSTTLEVSESVEDAAVSPEAEESGEVESAEDAEL